METSSLKDLASKHAARRKWLLLAFLALPAIGFHALSTRSPAAPAGSLLYVVNSKGDGGLVGTDTVCDDGTGHCTLRAAMEAANFHPGVDGIRFNLPTDSVVNLTHALPNITEGVTITSANSVAVGRNSAAAYRVFTVATTDLVTFSGLIIDFGIADNGGGGIAVVTNGRVNVTNCIISRNTYTSLTTAAGGGIQNGTRNSPNSVMNITNCTFYANIAPLGGAISNYGTINITNSAFIINQATLVGGGLLNFDGGTAKLINCTFSQNVSNGVGGGLENDGILTLDYCTLTGNTAIPSQGQGNNSNFGGGIVNGSSGTLTITNSTLSSNVAGCSHDCPANTSASGGGIYNVGTVNMTNSTLNNNSARGYITSQGTPNTISAGGAICNNSGILTLVNCTLSGNYVELYSSFTNYAFGGGLYQFSSPAPKIENTIIAGNLALADNVAVAGDPDVSGVVNSLGHNLISNTASSSGWIASDKINANAMPLNLGPLQSRGGPTQTMPLLTGSAAIDAGDDTVIGPPLNLTTDQRGPGFSRKINAHVDIGAFELLVPIAVSRKFHGTTAFDINLPFNGAAGIECRTGGVNSSHQVIATFPFAVSSISSASVTMGTGSVSNITISGSQVTINLAEAANAQTIGITLFGVSDGTNANDVTIAMSILLGDANGNGAVNATDISLTKSKSGQAVDTTNFRTDVTVSNSINSSDVSTVKSKSGTALP